MSRKLGALALALLAGALALTAALVRGPGPQAATASSHREAPLIADDPAADNTDVYAFRSPDRPDTVTFVANYIPLEEPAGGPNFNKFADDVLYAINVDNTGDGKEDISYQFRFTTKTVNPETFLYNGLPIGTPTGSPAAYPNFNRPQTYTVTRVENGRSTVIGQDVLVPPVNVGPRSTGGVGPTYDQLMSAAITNVGTGIKVFAGQVDDPFYVDLGAIFDLGGLRPLNPAHLLPLGAEDGIDDVSGFNTHTIAIQVPIDQLTKDGKTAAQTASPTIGVYASSSRQKIRILDKDGTANNRDGWVQVSRLGEPLVNEVIIPLGKKDLWNRADPADDSQFEKYYKAPELAGIENLLYLNALGTPARTTGRDDLVAILLTGVPGLNYTGPKEADLLRLNVSVAPCTSDPVDLSGSCSSFGVLAGDLAGFPNGRRLEDDVIDIELRAVGDGYGAFLGGPPPGGTGLLGLPNLTPNNTIGDGVVANDLPLTGTFPYLAAPHQGYDHAHDHTNN
jgi:hypothetical protein